VYSDLLQNPLLVPLKILLGHKTVNHKGKSSVEEQFKTCEIFMGFIYL
jgi:hypothetical protein